MKFVIKKAALQYYAVSHNMRAKPTDMGLKNIDDYEDQPFPIIFILDIKRRKLVFSTTH